MEGIILNLLMITLCTVIIVDISGIVNSIRATLAKWFKTSPERVNIKPFDCSLCLSHWINLGYLIISSEWTLLYYLMVLILSYMTPVFADLLLGLRDLLQRFTSKIK